MEQAYEFDSRFFFFFLFRADTSCYETLVARSDSFEKLTPAAEAFFECVSVAFKHAKKTSFCLPLLGDFESVPKKIKTIILEVNILLLQSMGLVGLTE